MAVVFDSVGFSAELDSLKSKVSDKLKSELKAVVTEEAKSKLGDENPNDAEAYTRFYNSVMPASNFKKDVIPEDVYKAMMLEAAVIDKTISKGFDIGNLDGKTVSAVASWFQGIFGKETMTVGKYKVTMQNNYSAQVKFPSGNTYSVTWTLDDTAKNALKAYIADLKDYLVDYRYQIYGAIVKDGLSTLINEFVAEVAEGVDKARENLIKSFHEWALNEAADVAIDKILPDTYKQIKAVEENYKTFVSTLNGLKEYVAKVNDDSIKGSKKYTAFVTTYNNLGIGSYVDVVDNYLSYQFLETVGGVFDQSKALITGTDSDNQISASGSYVTIKGGGGDDFISASGFKSKISGDAGNDKVLLKSSQGSISGGNGSDSIIVDGQRNTVLGGANDDYIALFKGKNTVTGGTGNDTIYIVGAGESVIKYNSGDGNDTIIGYDATDTIKITGNYSAQTSGQDVIITVGNSSIKLVGASGKKININDTVKAIGKLSNDDEVTEYTLPSGFDTTEYVKYKYGTNGDDDITNYSNKTKINGGAGNDYIYNGGDVTTINAGAGNDSIHNLGANVLINGDSDDDTIQNGVEDAGYWRKYDHDITINGGAGNDSIRNYFIGAVSINGGAGNDSILNTIDRLYNDNGTATIFGEKGNDYIFNENVSAMIDGGNSNDTINNRAGSSTIYGGTGNDSIYNSGGYTLIDGGNGNDFIRQSEGNNSTINGDAGNDKIEVYHGYRFYESVSNNYTIDGGDGNDLIELSGYSHDDLILFERNAGNDTVYGFTATDTLSVLGGGYVTASGNDIIAKSGSGAITLKDARFEMLNIIFSDGSDTSSALYAEGSKKNDSIVNSLSGSTINIGSGDDTVHNYGSQVSINGGAGDDSICNYKREVWNSETQKYGWITPDNVTIDGGKGNDFIYKAREEILVPITEGKNKGNYEIHNGGTNSLIEYTAGDGNDTIEGFGNTDTLRISGSNYSFVMKGDDLVITVGDEEIIWKDARHLHEHNIVRQVNTETLTNKNSAKVTIGADMDVADASKRTKAIKIVGNSFDNTILGGSKNDSLYGGKGADSLVGNAGNDRLYGQAGNDTIQGGKGADVFIYSAGNDVVADFATGDKISLGAAISQTSIKGSDATFTTSKNNTLTVKNGKGKELIVINAKGKEQTIIGGALLATKSATLESWREVGDASTATANIKLTGNAKNNTLYGGVKNDTLSGVAGADKLYGNAGNDSLSGGNGADTLSGGAGNDKLYGGNGNDSLWGGAGNDSLWGNAGADTFIYANGDGKDVIYGFENSDILQITGTFTGSYNKNKKEIAFTIGKTSGALTLKSFTATSFNINGDNYKISGSKIMK